MNICTQGYQDAILRRPATDLTNWSEDARTSYLDGYREGTRDLVEQNRRKAKKAEKMESGIIEVKIRLYLKQAVDEIEAQRIIDEMNYQFRHSTIGNSEIVENKLI